MIEAGLEAILIKVAGLGLHPKHLGRTLSQMKPVFENLVRAHPQRKWYHVYASIEPKHMLYGSHICGEGGEYETLTLAGPLFHRRINL